MGLNFGSIENTNMTFQTLYHRGRTGAIYQWAVWSEDEKIFTEYGQVGGVMQISEKIAEAKNVGRSNETSPSEQAELEAKSLHTFKLERKYYTDIQQCRESTKISPMLAIGKKTWEDTEKCIIYPCHIQPKLDGNRCIAFRDETGKVVLMSRGDKEWNLPHIQIQLNSILTEHDILDGELYVHGESCQTITSYVKKYKAGQTERVKFYIYDYPESEAGTNLIWRERETKLRYLKLKLEEMPELDKLEIVPSVIAYNHNDILRIHDQYVEDGYEGAIARNLTGLYEYGYRSRNLIKLKAFDDTEFLIVGFTNGRGKNKTTVTWECVTEEGKYFTVVPTGNKRDRAEMLKNGDMHIGKLLKVKHFGWTDENKPRFPVGIAFRENNE